MFVPSHIPVVVDPELPDRRSPYEMEVIILDNSPLLRSSGKVPLSDVIVSLLAGY